MENMKTKDDFIQALSTIIVISVMIGVSEILGEKEIIFPEVTALAVGMFLAPAMPWKTSYTRMLITITVCAVLGVTIVLFVPTSLWLQMSLAYFVGQIVLVLSKTSFAPMISAIVLPVMMQTKEIIYIIAAIALTTLIIVIKVILDRTKIKNKEVYVKKEWPDKGEIIKIVFRSIIVMALIYIAIKIDKRFCVAPPLLVAFTELTNVNSKARNMPVKVIATISLCALIGAMMRFIFVIQLGCALTIAAVLAGICMIIVVKTIKLYLPPAGAMTVLAMLIPKESVMIYPLQVFVGITVLFLIARFCFTKEKKKI